MSLDFTCKLCYKVVGTNFVLKRHYRNIHKIEPPPPPRKAFTCSSCYKSFSVAGNLRRHLDTKHKQEAFTMKTNKNINCREPGCDYACTFIWQLSKHLVKVHSKCIDVEEHQFDSESGFLSWKNEFELKTNSAYFARGSTNSMNGFVKYYDCHRSGKYSSKSTGKRQPKSSGSCKIGNYCTSHIVLTVFDKKWHVKCVCTHYGHVPEVKNKRLNYSKRCIIAEKLKAGCTRESILSDMNSSLLSMKELLKIEQEFKILSNSDSTKLHISDSISSWVSDMQTQDDSQLVIYFKPHGYYDKTYKFQDKALLLIVSNKEQTLKMCHKVDVLCVDTMHSINNYYLITIFTRDSTGQALPCIFIFSDKRDQTATKLYLEILKEHIGMLKVDVFMSDDSDICNSWTEVMGPVKQHSMWHSKDDELERLDKNECEINNIICSSWEKLNCPELIIKGMLCKHDHCLKSNFAVTKQLIGDNFNKEMENIQMGTSVKNQVCVIFLKQPEVNKELSAEQEQLKRISETEHKVSHKSGPFVLRVKPADKC